MGQSAACGIVRQSRLDPRVAVLAADWDKVYRPGTVAYAAGGPPVCTTLEAMILPPVTVAVPW
jgi:hypothetical protein